MKKDKVLTILGRIQKGDGPYQMHRAPKDQSKCIVLNCEVCGHDIWASEKKRGHKKHLDENDEPGMFMCMQCACKTTRIPPEELKNIKDFDGAAH